VAVAAPSPVAVSVTEYRKQGFSQILDDSVTLRFASFLKYRFMDRRSSGVCFWSVVFVFVFVFIVNALV
jgi:hypothetical protein